MRELQISITGKNNNIFRIFNHSKLIASGFKRQKSDEYIGLTFFDGKTVSFREDTPELLLHVVKLSIDRTDRFDNTMDLDLPEQIP